MTLDAGTRHILRLAERDADTDGWAKVSSVLWPIIAKLPNDLVERRAADDGSGHVRLTPGGQAVIMYG